MSETINREAHDKTKGFRLQKLRAVRLILSAVEQSQIVHVYSAIECVEDVYVKSDGCERSEEYIEEDKYYAVTTTFTLNSQPVINTLVSFLDVWIDRRFDDTLTFGFYTTSVIGKENETKTIKEACIKLPSTPLLESLKDQDFTDPTVVEAASELVKIEYKKQYSTPANPNHIRQIEKFDSGMWIRFFSRIEWFLGAEDSDKIKLDIIELIQSSKYYKPGLEGREMILMRCLVDTFDERQSVDNFSGRFVTSDTVKLAYTEVAAQATPLQEDCVWELWGKTEPADERGLFEKIEEICPDYSGRNKSRKAKMVARAELEEQNYSHDTSFLSLRYRVMEFCDQYIDKNCSPDGGSSEIDINDFLEKLSKETDVKVEDLSKVFKYKFNDSSIIEAMIVKLFDDCFLGFE